MLRLKAKALIAQSGHNVAPAERCLTAALALAQKQEARFWELRAGTALAELWKQQGRRSEARDLLTPALRWFSEGLGTADVRGAAALLAELA